MSDSEDRYRSGHSEGTISELDWDEMPDDQSVEVAAQCFVMDVDEFVEAVGGIADQTGMDEVHFELVAHLVAKGPKANAIAFIDECEASLDVLPEE